LPPDATLALDRADLLVVLDDLAIALAVLLLDQSPVEGEFHTMGVY
jgi:hypothetical protein